MLVKKFTEYLSIIKTWSINHIFCQNFANRQWKENRKFPTFLSLQKENFSIISNLIIIKINICKYLK